jgi:hypothetical protein
MIDPKAILDATLAATQFGATAQAGMTAPFTAGIASMNVASSSNSSNVIGGIQQISQQSLGHMTAIKTSIDSQLFAHQGMQRAQQSYDFKTDMDDLRPTDARGFPNELDAEFHKVFNKK